MASSRNLVMAWHSVELGRTDRAAAMGDRRQVWERLPKACAQREDSVISSAPFCPSGVTTRAWLPAGSFAR